MVNHISLDPIKKFVAAWYFALDIHAPIEECLSMPAENGLHMHFPDADIRDFATFKQWYDRVINLFFEEKHTIRNADFAARVEDIIEHEIKDYIIAVKPRDDGKSPETESNPNNKK